MITTTHYGERAVHDQAAQRLYEWYNNTMQKNQHAEVVKVGPKGYIHGWIKVGSPAHADLQNNVKFKDTKDMITSHLDKAAEASSKGDHHAAVWHLDKAHERAAMINTVPALTDKIKSAKASEKKKLAAMTDADRTELGRRAAVNALDAQIDRDREAHLDHFAKTGEILPPKKHQYPPTIDRGTSETSHGKALRLTSEANDDVKSAHDDIKNLALGPKQNAVLNAVHGAPNANPKRSAKAIRSALRSLGSSNPVAAARLKTSLGKANEAGKAWDDHLGFATNA